MKTKGSPFLVTLYDTLCKEKFANIIRWSADGKEIEILDEMRLEQEVLKDLFNHNKMSSFVRQVT